MRLKPVVALVLSALLLGSTFAVAGDPWDQPVNDPATAAPTGPSSGNEYPGPNPVPDDSNLPPLDPNLMISPAVEYSIRGGYAGDVDNGGINSGGGVGAVLFMDGGRTGIMISTQIVSGQGGIFAYAEGDAKIRYRMAIDPKHIVWGGVGLDISGRGAVDPRVNSYFTAQLPVAFIGTMFNVAGKCVIHIFAKAAFGIFDNQTQAKQWDASWDTFARPAVGGEALAACGSVRVIADYQHIFSFGHYGDTDKASLSYSQTWAVGTSGWELGYFMKGDYVREAGLRGAMANDPAGDARNLGQFFTGLEVRWGAPSAKLPK